MRDFDLGRVTPFVLQSENEETVEVTATAAWLRAWQRTVLSSQQRALVRAACTQIAKDRVHPCLGKRAVGIEPVGSVWMAAPSPGVTVTWRAHWSSPDIPVMMTLTYEPASV